MIKIYDIEFVNFLKVINNILKLEFENTTQSNLGKISMLAQNFWGNMSILIFFKMDFWRKFQFLTKFQFLDKMSILIYEFRFLGKFQFLTKFQFLGKIDFDQNFNF